MRSLLAGVGMLLLAFLAACAPALADGAPQCQGDLKGSKYPPVLLIHGTGVTAEENWSWGYQKALLDRGEPVCTIDLTMRATVDMQDTLPLTAAAISAIAQRAGGRKIALIGHSQGAAQAVLALRFWPQLAPLVDDVIGLSGAYDRGSAAIKADCAKSCIPPFWQFAPGSRFLAALATRPMPPGPSITAIGTLYDTVVTPQPAANYVPGGRSFEIQDICPGRQFVNGLDHIHMAADAVAYAAAIDALDHPGPADPQRVSKLNCALDVFPGADPVKLATLGPQLLASFQGAGSGPAVDREPPLRCPFAAGCDVLASFRAVRRDVEARGAVPLRVNVAREGSLRLSFGGDTTTRALHVEQGKRTLRIPLPALPAGVQAATVEAQSVPGTPWAPVGAIRLRIRSQ